MNPNNDLPLLQDKHYVSDVATQQDGVPQVTTDTLALLLPTSSNLPTDYNQPPQRSQQMTIVPTSQDTQYTSNGATAQLDLGETNSVPLQEGRYRDIVRYTNGSQFYDVVRQLEVLQLNMVLLMSLLAILCIKQN